MTTFVSVKGGGISNNERRGEGFTRRRKRGARAEDLNGAVPKRLEAGRATNRPLLEWLHDAAIVERFGVDTSAVVIGGHSFGGGATMAYAARDPHVRAIVSLAGTDHGVFIRLYQEDATFAERIGGFIRSTQAPEGPAHFDFDETIRQLAENQEVFGLQENATQLADRSILLIGGWEDTNTTVDDYMLPLYRALRGAGAQDVTFLVYHDNHGFGQVRERLANDVRGRVLRTTGHDE